MKNLIYITSHRQVDELEYFAKFLNRTKIIREYHLILHINKPDIDLNRVRSSFLAFPNKVKHLIITDKNCGYKLGPHEAISDFYNHIAGYDNVVHMHPDVFIIDEDKLIEVIDSNTDCGIIYGSGGPEPGSGKPQMFDTDLFIIRPKLLNKNIFEAFSEPQFKNSICEEFFEATIKNNNVKRVLVPKYENNWYLPRRPSLWGCWHEHDLHRLKI